MSEVLITDSWLRKHSINGAHTAAQLQVLGLPWPPPAGWRNALLLGAQRLSESQAAEFERLHGEREAYLAAKALRHKEASEEVYYTWPDGKGSWTGSAEKPAWWDSPGLHPTNPEGNKAPRLG